jgi:hypothetical protein
MYYYKTVEDIASLTIDDSFKATYDLDELHAEQQLVDQAEADKLIKEFEDMDGELCHAENSIMGKYEVFHKMRP